MPDGVRGLEKGCAMPVEMAGGGVSRAATSGDWGNGVEENERTGGKGRNEDARRRQLRQIMIVVLLSSAIW